MPGEKLWAILWRQAIPASESLPLVRNRPSGYDPGAMDGSAPTCLPEPSRSPGGLGSRLANWTALIVLVVWQGWMTLGLFGPAEPLTHLLNDEPIVSGRHPLHLYHGCL